MIDPKSYHFELPAMDRPKLIAINEQYNPSYSWLTENRSGSRGSRDVFKVIDTIVIHATAGYATQHAIDTWKSNRYGSAHWIVPDEDELAHENFVWATVSEARAAQHVRNKIKPDEFVGAGPNFNKRSLGIEIVNTQDVQNFKDPYSDWQVKATAKIVLYAWAKYPNLKHVIALAKLDPSRRKDPGINFPWGKFKQEVLTKSAYVYINSITIASFNNPYLLRESASDRFSTFSINKDNRKFVSTNISSLSDSYVPPLEYKDTNSPLIINSSSLYDFVSNGVPYTDEIRNIQIVKRNNAKNKNLIELREDENIFLKISSKALPKPTNIDDINCILNVDSILNEHSCDAIMLKKDNINVKFFETGSIKKRMKPNCGGNHPDAIQLIPNYRYAGGSLSNITIDTDVKNKTVEFNLVGDRNHQGIMASDGIFYNLKLKNLNFNTSHEDAIYINGMISGEISDITLKGNAKIILNPIRLAGGPGVYIASPSQDPSFYKTIKGLAALKKKYPGRVENNRKALDKKGSAEFKKIYY